MKRIYNKVGIVLFEYPKYSETFFRTLIELLYNNQYEVIVFFKNQKFIFKGVRLNDNIIKSKFRIFNLFFNILKLIITKPNLIFKLYNLNLKDNLNLTENIKSILFSSKILQFNLDIVYFGFANVANQYQNIAKVLGARSIVSLRGFDVAVYPIIHSICYKKMFQKIDRVHSISYDLLKRASKLGLDNDKYCKIITPAIDTKRFEIFNDEKLSIQFQEKKIVFMTTGRLHWIKNYSAVFLSLYHLKQKYKISFEYRIAGIGPEYESLMFMRQELDLVNEVRFLGKLNSTEIVKNLDDADIYLQYSKHEGFCNSVLEAQKMACICIVSNVGGLPENIKHDVTGFVVEPNNSWALTETIYSIINFEASKLKTIRLNAISRVDKEFSLKLYSEKTLNLFEF